eukprot:1152215-Pelagomonas_calceolata.AAC.1
MLPSVCVIACDDYLNFHIAVEEGSRAIPCRPGAGTFQHTEAETVNEETEEKGYVHRMQNQCFTTGAHKGRGSSIHIAMLSGTNASQIWATPHLQQRA